MKFISDETWAWFKTAPLPVLMFSCFISTGSLATWIYANEQDRAADKTKVEVAVNKAKSAEDAAKRAEDKMDKANDKLDRLLEAVVEIKAEQKAKKEKK